MRCMFFTTCEGYQRYRPNTPKCSSRLEFSFVHVCFTDLFALFPRRYLAAGLCSRHMSRLCTLDEIFDGSVSAVSVKPEPFWGPVSKPNPQNAGAFSGLWVPYLLPGGPNNNEAIDVQWARYDSGEGKATIRYSGWWHANTEYNYALTQHIACCGGYGRPASMAVDGDSATYWQSAAKLGGPETLTLDVSSNGAVLDKISIEWGQEYATNFDVLASGDGGSSFYQLATYRNATGGNTSVLVWPEPRLITHVRIVMTQRAVDKNYFSIREVSLRGCQSGLVSVNVSTYAETAVNLSPSIISVTPVRGTTAGGTDVTITGNVFGADKSDISVTFGDFPCAVTGVVDASNGLSNITCKTSKSGLENSGNKYVVVTVAGKGSSQPGALGGTRDIFWYIDVWSARTTWGGQAPPTGCGEYVEDQFCKESVVIPEGQVVLMDVSPPRFFLLLVEGTLIFDRQDLHLQAHYILLRGGRLEIGTEQEPFMQNALITLYGHPKSTELPTFGAKVIACYRCQIDMHGAPHVAWTKLAATAEVSLTCGDF